MIKKLFMAVSLFFFSFVNNSIYSSNDAHACPPQFINQLVNGDYFGAFRLGFHAGQYLDSHFGLSSHDQSAVWITTHGIYNALSGYWIFRSDTHQCWQAQHANGPLVFWNADNKATGNPEDCELFVFEMANETHSEVVVRNIYGKYVRYEGPHFVCDADRAHAASFIPEF